MRYLIQVEDAVGIKSLLNSAITIHRESGNDFNCFRYTFFARERQLAVIWIGHKFSTLHRAETAGDDTLVTALNI